MSDREILFTALDGVERRLRLNRNLKHLCAAASSVIAAAIVAVALGAVTPSRPGLSGMSLVGTLFVLAVVVIAAVALVRMFRGGTREEAAAEADLRGGLHDTLASALWFSTRDDASPWIPLLLARAAKLAASLDPVRLVPLVAPRGVRTVVVLALVLGGLSWIAPKFRSMADTPPDDATTARLAVAERVAELRKAADEAGRRGDLAAKSKLEQVLAALERPDASDDEKRRALEEARQLTEQRSLEAATDRERLRQIADQLGGSAEFGEVAEALRAGDAKGAAEALKKVVSARGEPIAAREPTPADGPKPPNDASLVESLQESLQSAAQNADREVTGETQGKIAKAVQNLEEIAKRLDGAAALNQARRKLDAVSMSMARESRLRAGRFGQQEGTPNGQSPETGGADIKGGTMYRQAAVAKEGEGERDGGRTGDASGNAQGDPVLGDEVKRPEAKYRLETVRSENRDGDDAGDDVFYAASRQVEAKTQYRAAPPQYRHAAEEAMSPERIALRHRPIVKGYFTQLREQDAK
jgi:exonuclease VII small subunit